MRGAPSYAVSRDGVRARARGLGKSTYSQANRVSEAARLVVVVRAAPSSSRQVQGGLEGKENKRTTSLDEPPDGGVAGEGSQGGLGALLWCGENTTTLEVDEGVETSPPTDHLGEDSPDRRLRNVVSAVSARLTAGVGW